MKPKICLAILASVLFILIAWNASISDVRAGDQNVQKISNKSTSPPGSQLYLEGSQRQDQIFERLSG